VLGHEFIGEIVEVGPQVRQHTVGDRVVVCSFVSCGRCWYCAQGLYSACDNGNTNPAITEAMWGFAPGGVFGYSHAMGGFAGSHAQYVRVPYADIGAFRIPDGVSDERALFASDSAPTGWMGADLGGVKGGDVVAVWGAGAVGQLAARAAMLLGAERVIVIDSATACGGLGMMMLGAAAVARAGGDRGAVEARARETREHLKVWFAIDTMEFLRRGGRVGAARAWLGSTLKIKPILTVESEITPIERVRTSRRAFERMVDYLRSRHEDGADGWMVQHIQARDQADELAARGKEIFGSEPLLIGEVGPVIGTHVGPGLLGVGGVPKRLLEA